MDKDGIYIVLHIGGRGRIWGFVDGGDILEDTETARVVLKGRCDGAPAKFLSDLIVHMEKAKDLEKSNPEKE